MVRPTIGTSVDVSLAVVGPPVGGSSVVGPPDVGSLAFGTAFDAPVVGSS